MAKTWYPVIDYTTCQECGTCVSFCQHGVYDKAKSPSPVVMNPMGCIDHCHGCGSKCPAGAITYVGDDTGRTPPGGELRETVAPCCCDNERSVSIEYLYLDLQTCDRCIRTDTVLDEVVATLTPALEQAGYHVEYRKTEMKTVEIAMEYRFLSSPTIRVNGKDICKSVEESNCACCGEISGTTVGCRVFEYDGQRYEVPPKEMLAEAILMAVFGAADGCACGSYELPENLKRFYDGKAVKSCCCGGN